MMDIPQSPLTATEHPIQSTGQDSAPSISRQGRDATEFICGVVEGFYGKPWTCFQRRDLFKQLKLLKLNAFMYAPKDDAKHRAKWRQLYDEREARELKTLIDGAASNGIDFYYSLAPGLDMIYSNDEDARLLFRKFDQLRQLGCTSFAILFDDIEPNITNAQDKVIFKDNYAAAQVSITNSIYNYLSRPKFLFCPTEYCESRAVPNVPNSLYLNTIGDGLHPEIDIMWSGSRVVSRYITEESIQTLSEVIKRPPVIWENLHANDYDKKRVFLGPYSGRSTKIIPKLRGVLTNPNCEYEANYIAIHTLAQWSKCSQDANPLNKCNQMISSEARDLLRQQLTSSQSPPSDVISSKVYDPNAALIEAIRDWLPHVLLNRPLTDHLDASLMRHHRSDEIACSQLSKETTDSSTGYGADNEVEMPDESQSSPNNQAVTSLTTATNTINNPTTISSGKSDMETSELPPVSMVNTVDSNSCDSCEMRDITEEASTTTITTETTAAKQVPISEAIKHGTDLDGDCVVCSSATAIDCHQSAGQVDSEKLALIVDFFYLPFEHGLRAHTLLRDIKWLMDHCGILTSQNSDNNNSPCKSDVTQEAMMLAVNPDGDRDDDRDQSVASSNQVDADNDSHELIRVWLNRAELLNESCIKLARTINSLLNDCPNKLLTVELYPYLVELRDTMVMIIEYIKYLRYRKSSLDVFYHNNPSGPKYKEVASSDEQEPWVHRGGLIGDVHRLIS